VQTARLINNALKIQITSSNQENMFLYRQTYVLPRAHHYMWKIKAFSWFVSIIMNANTTHQLCRLVPLIPVMGKSVVRLCGAHQDYKCSSSTHWTAILWMYNCSPLRRSSTVPTQHYSFSPSLSCKLGTAPFHLFDYVNSTLLFFTFSAM